MADDIPGGGASHEPPATAPAAAAPSIDPAEYARLQEEVSQYRSTWAQLEPHADRINRLISDEDFRNFNDQSYDTYKTMREKRNEPEPLPENLRPMYEKIEKLDSFVSTLQSREAQAAKDEEAKWTQENLDYAKRLSAEHPHLKEGNSLVRVAAFADSMARVEGRRVGIEEAWKAMQSFNPQSAPPPTSLRADSGAVGIPDKSSRDASRYTKDFHGAIVEDLKRARSAS